MLLTCLVQAYRSLRSALGTCRHAARPLNPDSLISRRFERLIHVGTGRSAAANRAAPCHVVAASPGRFDFGDCVPPGACLPPIWVTIKLDLLQWQRKWSCFAQYARSKPSHGLQAQQQYIIMTVGSPQVMQLVSIFMFLKSKLAQRLQF